MINNKANILRERINNVESMINENINELRPSITSAEFIKEYEESNNKNNPQWTYWNC